MSTLSNVNFTPVSDLMALMRRDFPLADPTLATPLNAVALVDGEWVRFNSSRLLIRATDITSVGSYLPSGVTKASGLLFPVFSPRGASDVQANSGRRTSVICGGVGEFNTRIFDATAVVHNGQAISYIGQPLKVATISFSSRNFTGIVGAGDFGSSDTDPIIGYVSALPAQNGGQLRFMSGSRR